MVPDNYIPVLEDRDLLWISYDKNVPQNHGGISFKLRLNERGEIIADTISHQQPDPSTIWIHLPIEKTDRIDPLPYFPHYIDLSPAQRYSYLSWLRNIDSPISTGYVFMYFYGLERHLLIGDIERAVKQIIRLRNNHKNKSLQTYTQNSIIHSCIMRGRLDILANVHNETVIQDFSNAQILLAHNFKLGLSAENLIYIYYKLYPKSRKAIKENKGLLIQCTEKMLNERYGSTSMTLDDIDVSRTPTVNEVRFCNYTFPDDIRFVEITDYLRCKDFTRKIDDIFSPSYCEYKVVKRKKNNHENKD